jgi:hypothetical protein
MSGQKPLLMPRIEALYSARYFYPKFLVPDWGDIVDSGKELSYRPARLNTRSVHDVVFHIDRKINYFIYYLLFI